MSCNCSISSWDSCFTPVPFLSSFCFAYLVTSSMLPSDLFLSHYSLCPVPYFTYGPACSMHYLPLFPSSKISHRARVFSSVNPLSVPRTAVFLRFQQSSSSLHSGLPLIPNQFTLPFEELLTVMGFILLCSKWFIVVIPSITEEASCLTGR